MAEDRTFQDLILRVRAGEPDAAVELVRRYEPVIRRAVRFRLADAGLRSFLDSMDICQSVLASFFVRTAAGQYDIDTPEHLVKLLVSMARNKLTSEVRKDQAERRGGEWTEAVGQTISTVATTVADPSQEILAAELFEEVYRRLSSQERQLVELRNQGQDWDSIAARLGGSSVGLRKQFSRALDRITRQLGLDGEAS
jgi:RNA polymerase sigma-70 factor (ECF subfamily)